MEDSANQVRPIYKKQVKIHDWQNSYLAFPLDKEHPTHKSDSHYKSLGPSNEIFIPKTSTKEAMEEGIRRQSSSAASRRAIVNFTSYPLIDSELVKFENEQKRSVALTKKDELISTYTMSYFKSLEPNKPYCEKGAKPHFLFNRIPKNFLDSSLGLANKFLDDHLYDNMEDGRKCIDYMRQIRYYEGTSRRL